MAGIMFISGGGLGKITQAANTRIQLLVGGVGKLFTHLTSLRITTGATAHVITLMRAHSRSTVASDLAATGTALVVNDVLAKSDATAPANNDLVAVKLDNGTWHQTLISAWTAGTKTLTLVTQIPTGRTAKKGAQVCLFGVAADTFHARYQYDSPTGTNQFPAVSVDGGSLVKGSGVGDPLIVDVDNPTNASTIALATFGNTKG